MLNIFLTCLLHLAAMTTSNISSSLATFDDLENGFSNQEIHARLLHFWEARNPNKGDNLMGLELLLLDEKYAAIQVFIAANRIDRFASALQTQAVYSIQNFRVTDNKNSYRVTAHKSLIHFTDQTVLAKIDYEPNRFEMDKFNIRSYEDFDTQADTNEDLLDALGQIILIDNGHSYMDNKNGRLSIHLHLKDGPIVRLTLWTTVAMKFREALAGMTTNPQVLLVTAINPRKIGGLLYLNSTSATRFFMDSDVPPTMEYLTWATKNKVDGGKISFPSSEVTKLESVTIAELTAFLATKPPQQAGFTCDATITNIVSDYGWNYIACTKCTCKLKRTATKLVCTKCNDDNAVGILRYRVELSVMDKDNDTATFVIFDREATRLTGKKAVDIHENINQDANNGGGQNKGSIPQCLLDTVGKSYTFQLKVTEYNFNASRQTITVSRILHNQTAHIPKTPKNGDLGMGIKDIPGEEEKATKANGKRIKLG